ncbi:MAG: hypothetical protein MHM6MM_005332 [Cercozoa sp. M6MM]
MSDEQMKSALNLMRRMPPAEVETSLSGLISLVPDLTDELLQRVDQPLKVAVDPESGKHYVLCDYNRDGDSYRSPWSNKYFPALDDGFLPSDALRTLEKEANFVFDRYRQLYFEGGHSSVYMWDLDDGNFAACFLVQKDAEQVAGLAAASWSSIHIVEATCLGGNKWQYKLTTTVMVSMDVDSAQLGKADLSGSMTKQLQREITLDDDHTHVMNMGKMVEDLEKDIRNSIEGIYIQKTRDVINGMRSADNARKAQLRDFSAQLSEAVTTHGKKG